MSNTLETAHHFIDACETGKGWDFCSTYCHQDATFSSQIATLESISSLESYCEWVKNLLIIVSDGKYELKFTVADIKLIDREVRAKHATLRAKNIDSSMCVTFKAL
jgi:hypothetical protein